MTAEAIQSFAWHSRLLATSSDEGRSSPGPNTYSDKVILPPSVLQSLLDQSNGFDQLPSPLLFKVTNLQSGKSTHVGVREFSAVENTIQLPPGVSRNLDLTQPSNIGVSLEVLPKGTALSLKPLNPGDEDDVDWKSLLESKLHGAFTALTKGDVLTIPDPIRESKTYDFLIADIQPADAVCIVDTELDLDIVPSGQNRPKVPAKRNMEPVSLEVGQAVDVIDLEPDSDFKVIVAVTSWTEPLSFKYSVPDSASGSDAGDLEMVKMYAGTSDITSSSCFLWSNVNSSKGEIVIHPSDPYLDASKDVYVVLHSNASTGVNFYFETRFGDSVEPGEVADTADTKECGNCHRRIATRSFQLHETFCLRNNLLCPGGCGRIFQKNAGVPASHWHCHECELVGDSGAEGQALHHRLAHEPKACSGCGAQFSNLTGCALHQATTCPAKLHVCRFCHLRLPQEEASPADALVGLTGHEAYCGNRTTDCEVCKRAVRLRELDSHMEYHNRIRLSKPTPLICHNEICPRPVDAGNNLGLCSFCFGPLHSTQHDPDGKQFRSRLERRYVIQLSGGCRKNWCMNPYCATGNPQPGRKMADVMELKEMLIAQSPAKFWFCVDQAATKRMLFVNTDEKAASYGREWSCQAIGATQGNEPEARRWLELNGVLVSEA